MPLCLLINDFTRESVRTSLRGDALHIVLGLMIIMAALLAGALFGLRQRERDAAAGWFGLFGLLYGARLLLDAGTVPFTLGFSDSHAQLARSLLTYVIQVPAAMFAYRVFLGWRPVIRWYLALAAVLAVTGISSDLITGRAWTLNVVNDVITLIAWGAFTIAIFGRPLANMRDLRWGVAAWSITILIANLRGLGLPVLPFDPEPIGFACFLVTIVRLLVVRSVQAEDRLVTLNKELEIATRIQLSILPRQMPDSANLKIAAKYLPMTEVAGDFYDFLRIDEQRLGILIADVSGHGVPAALIASMVKVAIAAQEPHAHDPALVMKGMNQVLCGKLQGQFVSAAYVYLDLEAGLFRYAAGGHPPLLWWRSEDQRVDCVVENGLILGIMSQAAYTATERKVQRGDRLLLYTDGLVESANETDEFFGEERVCEALSEARDLSAEGCAVSARSSRGIRREQTR